MEGECLMRKIMFISLLCLLLASCTIGITKRTEVAPSDDALVETRVAATVAALKLTTSPSTVTPLSGTPTSTPTSTPAPTKAAAAPKSTQVPTPVIHNFSANSPEINPGDSIYLTWTSSHATRAVLWQRPSASGVESAWRDVPPTGSLTLRTQSTDRHWQDFDLVVYNSAGIATSSTINVRFRCAYTLFFPTQSRWCPDGFAQSTKAAEQIFENGRMIWLEHAASLRQWGWDTGDKEDFVILVLYGQGYSGSAWQMFVDAWRESEPDSDPNTMPPQGKYQPIRGFGKVWRTHSEVRQKLGWAIGQEKGSDATYQQISGREADGNDQCAYVRTADARVINLCRKSGYWTFATP
jgi:hypothetical protein